jgi:hypothetical protein
MILLIMKRALASVYGLIRKTNVLGKPIQTLFEKLKYIWKKLFETH